MAGGGEAGGPVGGGDWGGEVAKEEGLAIFGFGAHLLGLELGLGFMRRGRESD